MLATPATAQERLNAAILEPAEKLSNKPSAEIYASVQAMFKIHGHVLTRSYRTADDKLSFLVSRWSYCRAFSDWADVQAFLRQIGGSHAS